jgi:flagellin
MSRISTSLSGIERTLLNRLAQATAATEVSTLRLATMQKINAAKDDPAAFVTLSGFQSQLSNVTAAMSNVNTASSMLSQTESLAGQVQDQLEIIRDELLSPTSSSQSVIDTALAQIDRLATTQVNGRRVLDGSADFLVTGRDASRVAQVQVSAMRSTTETIAGNVISSGSRATLRYTGGGGTTTAAAQITITGNLGSAAINVGNGESLDDLAEAINAVSYQTGVTATANGDDLDMTSVGYGSAQRVTVEVASGTFVSGTDYGTSGTAQINGVEYTASATDGNRYTVNDDGFRFEIQFQPGVTGTFNTMVVSGSALSFALSPDVGSQATLSIASLLTTSLGGYSGKLSQIGTGGTYSGLGDNTGQALRIVGEALGQVTRAQGNIGGFQRASIESASSLLTDLQEDLTDSIDAINAVDPTEETARISFYTALANNAISGLAILNEQRSLVVDMIKNIAGLR